MVEELKDRIIYIEQILHDKYVVPNAMVVELEAVVDKHARQEERMVADSLAQSLESLINEAGIYCQDCDTIVYDTGNHNVDHSFNSPSNVAKAKKVLKEYKARIITWGVVWI